MALQDREYMQTGARTSAAEYDAGLRAHMLRVYNYMGTGLAITGLMAFVIAQMSVQFGSNGEIVAFRQGVTKLSGEIVWMFIHHNNLRSKIKQLSIEL